MSSADYKPFFGDLRSAIRAGVPLEIGEGPSPAKALSVESLEQLESQHKRGDQLPPRLADAMQTWQRTGSMIPVLEGLSSRLSAWKRIGTIFRQALIYLLLIAVASIVGLSWYLISVLPEIEAVQNDLIDLANPVAPIEPTNMGLWATIALVVFVVILILAVTWLIKGGMTRAGWWIGADGYLHYQTLATAAKAVQALVADGESPQQAVLLSSRLTGLSPEAAGELVASVEGLERNSILRSEWSDYLQMIARQQFISAKIWGPTTMIALVGGFFVLLYVLIAWWPITSLIQDLSYRTKA